MQHFDAWRLAALFHQIDSARHDGIKFYIDAGKRDERVDEEFIKDWVTPILEGARLLSDKANLVSTNDRVHETGGLTLEIADGITYQSLDYELKILRQCLQLDLEKRFLYVIDTDKQNHLTQKTILDMWGLLGYYFPTTRTDAIAAMRSYAFGLNTASVFHLMRVTEIGLRALARRMRVKLPKKRQLEWAEWQDIIREMIKKADAAANRRAGAARDEILEFYRGSIGEFQGFKDAYRNFVMHMREKVKYDPHETKSLIDRVSHFMGRLAERIDEQGHVLTAARKKRIDAKYDSEIAKAKAEEKKQRNEQAKQGIPEVRSNNGGTSESSPQRDQEETGRGESGETEAQSGKEEKTI
jgi:hypothetical protein